MVSNAHIDDAIMTACRLHGRVTAPQIVEENPELKGSFIYWRLAYLFKKGILDRRLVFAANHWNKAAIYQYWLAEDPEGIE